MIAAANTPTRVTFYAVAVVVGLAALAQVSAVYFLYRGGLDPSAARPWTLIEYASAYGQDGRTLRLLAESVVVPLIPVALFAALLLWPQQKAWGDARWAYPREIRQAGLFARRGILVGQYRDEYLTFGGAEHVLVRAPTRSGKGVGFVIPNLLNWDQSAVVLDVKRENFEATSGFRAACGQAVYLWDPVSGDGHRWNPLSYVRDGANRINDLQNLAARLFPEPDREPMWTYEGRDVFIGAALYVIDHPEIPSTLGSVLRQFKTDKPTGQHFREIIEAEGEQLDPACHRALANFAAKPDKEQSGVKSTVTSGLALWENPQIDAATAADDFDFHDLRRRPMTLYIGIKPPDLDRLRPILNLFVQQLLDANTQELPEHNPALRYQVLALLDEFPALGKVEALTKGVAFLAGYGIRLAPVIQSSSQLREIYGRDAADQLETNMAVRLAFTPSTHEDANQLAEELGYKTVKQVSRTHGQGKGSRNISYTKKQLMMPQDLLRMPWKKQILLVKGTRPIWSNKIIWFRDRTFTRRRRSPVSLPAITPLSATDQRVPEPADLDLSDLAPDPDRDTPLTDEEIEATADALWARLNEASAA